MIASGFDSASQTWTSETRGGGIAQVPRLDGTLRIDEMALRGAGGDFGNLQRQLPIAVLEPASGGDVIRMVRFARENRIKIGPRGQAMSTHGETQVPGGLVVKMNALRPPPVFGPDWVQVSSGLTWADVLRASMERGLRPPVLTQTMFLSVGGTLSVGGIDGGSYRYAAQVDNVIELEVVTGMGELEVCSEGHNRSLFEAVLAGRGQCGIILSAKVRLIPAETHAIFLQLLYRDLAAVLADHRALISDGRFERVSTYASPSPRGSWIYYLQGAWSFTPPVEPDLAGLLAGLHHLRGFEHSSVLPYFDYADRGGKHQEQLIAQGRMSLPHPFFNAFLPDTALDRFAELVFGSLDPKLIEPDFPIECYAINTRLCQRPLLRLPDEPVAFLIDVLTTYANQALADRMLDLNQGFYERARQLGGKLYGTNTVTLGPEDWREHYGESWEQFARAKEQFDPEGILSPGPRIFHS